MKKMAVIFALTGLLIGCGEEPSVDIEIHDKVDPVFGIEYVEVKVKAISDEVTVKDVIVTNHYKNDCKIENIFNGKPILPKQLKFEESVSVSFSGPCRAERVDVVTNDGSWTVQCGFFADC
jgi:hypothetical protein